LYIFFNEGIQPSRKISTCYYFFIQILNLNEMHYTATICLKNPLY
jgi:hypothetical protein